MKAIEDADIPLPIPEITPPDTNIYLGMNESI